MAFFRRQAELDTYIKPELAGLLETADAWQGDWHCHSFTETVFVPDGVFSAATDSERLLLSAGMGLIIRPGVSHRFIAASTAGRLLYLGCSCRRQGTPLKTETSPF